MNETYLKVSNVALDDLLSIFQIAITALDNSITRDIISEELDLTNSEVEGLYMVLEDLTDE